MYSEVPCCLVYCGDNYDLMAEREGFEPPKDFRPLPVFKTGAINHSATSPELLQFYYSARICKRSASAFCVYFQSVTAASITLSVRGVFKTACFNRSHIPPLFNLPSFAIACKNPPRTMRRREHSRFSTPAMMTQN